MAIVNRYHSRSHLGSRILPIAIVSVATAALLGGCGRFEKLEPTEKRDRTGSTTTPPDSSTSKDPDQQDPNWKSLKEVTPGKGGSPGTGSPDGKGGAPGAGGTGGAGGAPAAPAAPGTPNTNDNVAQRSALSGSHDGKALPPEEKKHGSPGGGAKGTNREGSTRSALHDPASGSGVGIVPGEGSIKAVWDHATQQGRTWTAMTIKAIKANGMTLMTRAPEDIALYCVNYRALDAAGRVTFWTNFIANLSLAESLHETRKLDRKGFTDREGKLIALHGLLQLSVEGANQMGCKIGNSADLYDPETNINCGVKILNQLIHENGRVYASVTKGKDASGNEVVTWYGAPRYWRTFRRPEPHAKFREALQELPICKG